MSCDKSSLSISNIRICGIQVSHLIVVLTNPSPSNHIKIEKIFKE